MFVDASAIVAILIGEPEASELAALLESASSPFTTPISVYEAVLAVRRIKSGTVDDTAEDVRQFLYQAKVAVIPISEREADTALDAFARYGEGSGHPARLNLGDCFAYAVAKNHRVPMLFKGDDFSKTDIRSATARR